MIQNMQISFPSWGSWVRVPFTAHSRLCPSDFLSHAGHWFRCRTVFWRTAKTTLWCP